MDKEGPLTNTVSYGTDGLLNFFEESDGQLQKGYYDTVLVNIKTLIRNAINTHGDNYEKVLNALNSDSSQLLNTIAIYMGNFSKGVLNNPNAIFYISQYEIEESYRRKETKVNSRVEKFTKRYFSSLKNEEGEYSGIDYAVRKYNTCYTAQSLLKEIFDYEAKKKKGFGKLRRTLLISHCPIDFHLLFKMKNCRLLQSFTSKVLKYEDLSKKVFKNEDIPFCSPTHIAFGDNVDLKAFAFRKNKKLLFEQAKKNRWFARGEEYIINDISSTLQIPKSTFKRYKF